ncbi:MAG: nicotinate-nucleotide--dimethylbenzimidazole phosphoribosyltransferase [Acidobacteria bacterium]|nr:nicotinate-nucleotide--dimethylbenzimidazole phosphoribosyltransferase [Acidobacteriota bacterium]
MTKDTVMSIKSTTGSVMGQQPELGSNGLRETVGRIASLADPKLAQQVQQRLDSLTKPRGSLGRLEGIATEYSLARGTADWPLPTKALFVFCADHGITAEGVSAFPQDVTHQMVENFVRGGAAINVLCRQYDIDPIIIDMGVNHAFESGRGIVDRKVAFGTQNFSRCAAMTPEQAIESIETEISLARAAARLEYGLLAIGEMGIGNTTSASAITALLTNQPVEEVIGPGTGLNESQVEHKKEILRQALDARRVNREDPLEVLSAVGGFEIGGMCGFLLGAAAERVPVAVDGFIATSAALLAVGLAPSAKDYMFFSHRSAEPGHRSALDALDVKPLLALDMRLGEGTGAAMAIGVIESALRLYKEMATFASAEVSEKA